MSAPTLNDIQSLRFAHAGAPVAAISTTTADTSTLAFAWLAAPVVASAGAGSTPIPRPVVFVAM
jgi:hypothetical protein